MVKYLRQPSNTIIDLKNEYQDFTDRVSTDWQYVIHPTNYQIAIVSGNGVGQIRTITQNTDSSVTVDKPWDIIPEPGSRYVITQWSAQQYLVLNNVLRDNNRGIWVYSGGNDIVIAGNTLINSEGIYIRSDQRIFNNRYNLAWNISVMDNRIQNTNGLRPAYIAAYLAQVKSDKLFGTGILGLEIRRNAIQAFTPNVKNGWIRGEGFFNCVYDEEAKGGNRDTTSAGILGTVFEANRCSHAEQNYTISTGAKYTVLKDTMPGYSQEAAETAALQQYEAMNTARTRLANAGATSGSRFIGIAGTTHCSCVGQQHHSKTVYLSIFSSTVNRSRAVSSSPNTSEKYCAQHILMPTSISKISALVDLLPVRSYEQRHMMCTIPAPISSSFMYTAVKEQVSSIPCSATCAEHPLQKLF